MIGKAPLPLQMENKRPDFLVSDSCYVYACFLKGEKILKVVKAISDDGYGIMAFPFDDSTKLIPSK